MHEVLARKNFEKDVAILTPAFCERQKWRLNECAFPVMDVTILCKRPIRLRFIANNWREDPPSIQILTPHGADWTEDFAGANGVFNGSGHPRTGKKFICMRGSLEFHTHSSHLNESWAGHREKEGNLVGLLMQLDNVWRKGNDG